MQLLKTQLILKGIITKDDWHQFKEKIHFDFIEDNYFSELKQSEMIRERFELLGSVQEFVGKFISIEWATKNILNMDEDDKKQMDAQIAKEKSAGLYPAEDEF